MEELVQGIQDGANRVRLAWRRSGQQILRLEGFMGCGKSSIAALISEAEEVPVLNPDDFATSDDVISNTIAGRVDIKQLHASARKLSKRPVIFEGVCLEETLPNAKFGRGFLVYLKRVSPDVTPPIWRDEHELTATEPDSNPLIEDVRRYHRTHRPHERADLCLAVPEGRD